MLSLMDVEIAYNAALDYLYSFVDYSLKHTSELVKADFNLDRMRELMTMLGNPENSYPTIHVAGTKGKGSTAAMIASALHAAGYKTGLYISPHLQEFCERIQINNENIPPADFAALVEEIKPAVARIPFITTFELTTALGFLYFARQKVEVAVIEVGLGGRLDATNIITPIVSVITSLSYDHVTVLGNTITAIAGEKAGIIKDHRPIVSAPQMDDALAVLEREAEEHQAPLILVGCDVYYEIFEHSLQGQRLEIWLKNEPRLNLRIPLLGAHQAVNAAVACATLKTCQLIVSNEAIQKGFAEVRWPGRFEVMRREPPVVIDSAHNRDSASRLRQTLDEYFPNRPAILIFCALEDKDIFGMIEELAPRLACVIVTKADHPRAPEAEWIAEKVKETGVQVMVTTPVAAALKQALNLARNDNLILTAGSVAFAGEIRSVWQKLFSQSQMMVGAIP